MPNLKVITLTLFCLIGYSLFVSGQPTNYIEKYKDIAIQEMHRSGIPASITLAQGILESSWGNGALALKANNHFGIKCKSHWNGPRFYIEDDDYENGKLIKSCFRSYGNAEASYADHTDFLKSNDRYQELFGYHHTDFINWAYGLKKCGYATDKRYAQKLIANINKYNLHQYDIVPKMENVFANLSTEQADNTITNIEKPSSQQVLVMTEVVQEEVVPAAFQLPDNYQRGTGKVLFQKGDALLEESPTFLFQKRK